MKNYEPKEKVGLHRKCGFHNFLFFFYWIPSHHVFFNIKCQQNKILKSITYKLFMLGVLINCQLWLRRVIAVRIVKIKGEDTFYLFEYSVIIISILKL